MLRRTAMFLGVVVAICTLGVNHHAEASGGQRRLRPERADLAALQPRRAAHPSEVVGTVVDALGKAVANATVIATPAVPRPAFRAPRTQSDGRGHFHFVGLPPGEYVFVALHGDLSASVSPVMPLDDSLQLTLVVGGNELSA